MTTPQSSNAARARQEHTQQGAPTREQTADVSHVDAHGAIDLSTATPQSTPHASGAETAAVPGAGAPTGTTEPTTRLDVPLITQADESTFNDVMGTSQTVPVVIVLWSARALEARGAVDLLESFTREYSGRFQLVEIDADSSPAIAQAFRVQSLPAVIAVVGGRPVPLFQGSPVKEQVGPILDELLSAAAQMGVTGGVAVRAEDTVIPIPQEHVPALEAEERGDLDGAIANWEKVISHNPRDEDAKSALARVRLAKRSAEAGATSTAKSSDVRADQAFSAGNHAAAFDLLLDVIAATPAGEERDEARTHLLDLFRVAGNTDEVRVARRRLSTLLLV